jgi:hypothetical protein
MINPNDDDFIQSEPPIGATPSGEEPELSQVERRAPRFAQKVSPAGDTWEQTKAKASSTLERTEFFLRENPVPTIVGALTIGIALGWVLHYATRPEEKEIELKSPLGRINWGFLSLPFLWPLFKSLKEKYGDSTEVLKDSVGRLKNIDVERYTKPVRKRWKAWTH